MKTNLTSTLIKGSLFLLLFFSMSPGVFAQIQLRLRTDAQLQQYYQAKEAQAPPAIKAELSNLRTLRLMLG